MKTPLRLVVVDHDHFVCDAICGLLAACDIVALPVHDTQTARSLVQENRVDLALVEVRLPRENGVSLATHFRSLGVPTILMSGLRGTEPELANANVPLLYKPFRFADLLALVAPYCKLGAERLPV